MTVSGTPFTRFPSADEGSIITLGYSLFYPRSALKHRAERAKPAGAGYSAWFNSFRALMNFDNLIG
jgi:hypothetical protein